MKLHVATVLAYRHHYLWSCNCNPGISGANGVGYTTLLVVFPCHLNWLPVTSVADQRSSTVESEPTQAGAHQS